MTAEILNPEVTVDYARNARGIYGSEVGDSADLSLIDDGLIYTRTFSHATSELHPFDQTDATRKLVLAMAWFSKI